MKKLLFALLYSTRIIDLTSWFNRKRVPILCYHSVTSDSTPVHHDPYKQHIQLTLFLRHLDYLQQKYNVVSLADYVQARAGNRRLPDHSVVLTFDDGFEDFYSVAAPHLTERKLPATVFIIIDRACGRLVPDGESFLNWDQIRELEAAGIDIGSHSCSHLALPELPLADARKELADSHRILSSTLGRSQISLSYPFGKASEPISRTAKSLGYICAIGHDGGPNSPGNSLHQLNRTVIASDDDVATFAARVSGLTWWIARCRHLLGLQPPVRREKFVTYGAAAAELVD